MPAITITEAARRAGVQRSTLYRKARTGGLSVIKGADGKNRIEMSELLRVYPDAEQGAAPPVNGAQHRSKQHLQQAENVAENASLRRELSLLREQVHDLRGERDRLLGVIEVQTKQIADQRPAKERQTFWKWLTTSE